MNEENRYEVTAIIGPCSQDEVTDVITRVTKITKNVGGAIGYRVFSDEMESFEIELQKQNSKLFHALRETNEALSLQRGGGTPLTKADYLALWDRNRILLEDK